MKGKRNGKGHELYVNVFVKFEGEYLNGERWNGKVYDFSGHEKCEIKNGEKQMEKDNFKKNYLINDDLLFYFDFFSFEQLFVSYNRIFNSISINSNINTTDLTGKGKEYKNGKLVYRGEFVKGKRDGKGKEYNENELIFEGEYINGERNGKGKYYFFNELIFEGEYMDGIRNGLGKEYYINNKIKFEGEYQDGKINGKEKEYDYFGRLIYEGEYANNKRINGLVYKYKNNDFSKYEYLIPQKIISKYDNKVPIYLKRKYYYKYHIESPIVFIMKKN